jgi:hypothetical protein
LHDEASKENAFSTAAEFLSALAWENKAAVALWNSGGASYGIGSLKSCKPVVYTFPRIAYQGLVRGYDLVTIPYIQNEYQRIALALFREANASNNEYLSFLFFWQVLEVDGTEPIGFINRIYRKESSKLFLIAGTIKDLPLGLLTLGNYLYDDCRNAISHIRRNPGKKNLDIDRSSERLRLTRSVSVIKEFAEYYIRERLGLKEQLYLCYRNKRDIPRYVDSVELADDYTYKHVHRLQDHVGLTRLFKKQTNARSVKSDSRRPRFQVD